MALLGPEVRACVHACVRNGCLGTHTRAAATATIAPTHLKIPNRSTATNTGNARPPQVYVAADLGKIVSDEIYGPMFFQVRCGVVNVLACPWTRPFRLMGLNGASGWGC